ncbi:hypothetical protein L226DRAFT_527722 [Lentinus tigrinus ALCF2SS1-7]|uniref:uncharacterized protein n=1 Tax=Lentinus tigrinus ALCF2SS1-7 TaxID=1328758 RepID=UPI0011661184|nr:hypothetical protein L226DRAFT_527722 [Lentinus tigrinus ALCF2SS1-7]
MKHTVTGTEHEVTGMGFRGSKKGVSKIGKGLKEETGTSRRGEKGGAGPQTVTVVGRVTRMRTRADKGKYVAPPPASAKKGPTAAKTKPSGRPTPPIASSSDGKPFSWLQTSDTIWDPKADGIVDAAVVPRFACRRCGQRGINCRINITHGVVCEGCAKSSLGCSFAAKQPRAGPKWTYNQRRWIFYEWARTATAKTPHPAEVDRRSTMSVTLPQAFADELRAAQSKGAVGQKQTRRNKREGSSGVKHARGTPGQGSTSSLTKRKRQASPEDHDGADGKEEEQEEQEQEQEREREQEQDQDQEQEQQEQGKQQQEDISARRPAAKRRRTAAHAMGVVPQGNTELVHDQNVGGTTPGPYAAGSSASEDVYTPDFEHDMLQAIPDHPDASASTSPMSSRFSYIAPNAAGPHVITRINENHSYFNNNITTLWAALNRQQATHDAFKEEARKELAALTSSVATTSREAVAAMRERDAARQDLVSKDSKIARLRSQVLELEARLRVSQPPAASYSGGSRGRVGRWSASRSWTRDDRSDYYLEGRSNTSDARHGSNEPPSPPHGRGAQGWVDGWQEDAVSHGSPQGSDRSDDPREEETRARLEELPDEEMDDGFDELSEEESRDRPDEHRDDGNSERSDELPEEATPKPPGPARNSTLPRQSERARPPSAVWLEPKEKTRNETNDDALQGERDIASPDEEHPADDAPQGAPSVVSRDETVPPAEGTNTTEVEAPLSDVPVGREMPPIPLCNVGEAGRPSTSGSATATTRVGPEDTRAQRATTRLALLLASREGIKDGLSKQSGEGLV